MDLEFSKEDLAFRDEVRAFIAEAFDDDMRVKDHGPPERDMRPDDTERTDRDVLADGRPGIDDGARIDRGHHRVSRRAAAPAWR